MKLYKVTKQANDDRPESLVMREVYLDFYSKSLFEQQTKTDICSYSKRMQTEQQEHKQILDKIIQGMSPNSFKHMFDLGNGDPTIDPRLKTEDKLSSK